MASNNENNGNDQQSPDFVWNFDNIPASVRPEGNIGNVMQSIVPEIQRRINQPNPMRMQNPYLVQSNIDTTSFTPQHVTTPQQDTPHLVDMRPMAGGHGHSHANTSVPDENRNLDANPGNAQSAQANTLRSVWKMAQSWLPFALLLLTKLLYNHRLGILVFVALFFTFYHANGVLIRQIALKEQRTHDRSTLYLLWVIFFLSINIAFVYYIFEEQQLYKSLYLFPPNVESVDLWDLLWIVGISDFTIKFCSIIWKAFMAILPRNLLGFKRRGKYYMLLEYISQFYRTLVPITPWVNFLINDKQGGQLFSGILVILYTLCKGHLVFQKSMDLWHAFKRFFTDNTFGSSPNREEVSGQGEACPICQDDFRDPIMLSCKHIFCEDCVAVWFDREKTCPMCRAKIVDHVTWRDGATSPYLFIF